MALSHCRTQIRTRTRIPYTAIGDRDLSLDLCDVNFQYITLVAKGKILRIGVRVRIRVWQCERAIIPTIPDKGRGKCRSGAPCAFIFCTCSLRVLAECNLFSWEINSDLNQRSGKRPKNWLQPKESNLEQSALKSDCVTWNNGWKLIKGS